MTRRLIAMTGPGGPLPPRRRPRPRGQVRRRYLAVGAFSIVVGLGTVAFTAGGGGEATPGPRITPQVDLYSVEHAITTGEVPFTGPWLRSPAAATP